MRSLRQVSWGISFDMNRVLWKKMAILIDRYRTWITVQGIYRDDWFLFVSGGLLKRYANPVFNLIVKWPRGNKVRAQVIGISEYEMDRAIRKLSNADTSFARRIRCLEPTPKMWKQSFWKHRGATFSWS